MLTPQRVDRPERRLHDRLVRRGRVGHPGRVGEEPAGLAVFQPTDGEPRVDRVGLGHDRLMLSGITTGNTPPKNRHAASQPSMSASNVWEYVGPDEHVPRVDRGEDQRVHHPTPTIGLVGQQTQPAEVDLHLRTGFAVGDPHRGLALTELQFHYRITVQRPIRHHHTTATRAAYAPWSASSPAAARP